MCCTIGILLGRPNASFLIVPKKGGPSFEKILSYLTPPVVTIFCSVLNAGKKR